MINNINSNLNYNYINNTNNLNSKKNTQKNNSNNTSIKETNLNNNNIGNNKTNNNINTPLNNNNTQNPIQISNLVSDKSQATNQILGYGVDKDGFFTSDFNEAAGIPKDYKIYAKGLLDFVDNITDDALKPFTGIDIAKSIARAYKVFSQLVDEPKGNFSAEDLNKIPQYFQWDSKTLQVAKIYTKEEYLSAQNSKPTGIVDETNKNLYSSLINSISFPSYDSYGNGYLDRKADIFKLGTNIDIGKNIYTHTDGTISKGGALMAFFTSNSSYQFLCGETTIMGKLAGLDDDFGVDQITALRDFMQQNPISYSISGNVGVDLINELKLQDNTDVEKFKKEWLEMKAKSDAMGEKYKAEIANSKTIFSDENTDNKEKENKLKPIKGESQNKETYQNKDTNEVLKKLLENTFNLSKELEILLGVKINDEDINNNDFTKIFSKLNLYNIKSVDLKA